MTCKKYQCILFLGQNFYASSSFELQELQLFEYNGYSSTLFALKLVHMVLIHPL